MGSHQLPPLVLIVTFCFVLVALLLYLQTLQNALKNCAPASRTMKPGYVWLVAIPAFGLLWHFVVVLNIGLVFG
jgi:hypothetical protein